MLRNYYEYNAMHTLRTNADCINYDLNFVSVIVAVVFGVIYWFFIGLWVPSTYTGLSGNLASYLYTKSWKKYASCATPIGGSIRVVNQIALINDCEGE